MCPDPTRANPSSLLRTTMVHPEPALGWNPFPAGRGLRKPSPALPTPPTFRYSRVEYLEDPSCISAADAARGGGQRAMSYLHPVAPSEAAALAKTQPGATGPVLHQGNGAAVSAMAAAHANAASAQATAKAAADAAAAAATRAAACASTTSVQEQNALASFECDPPRFSIDDDLFSETHGIVPAEEMPEPLRQPCRTTQYIPRQHLEFAEPTGLLSGTRDSPFTGLATPENDFVEKRADHMGPSYSQCGPTNSLFLPEEPEVIVKSENVLDSNTAVSSDCEFGHAERGPPQPSVGADESVNLIVSSIFQDARCKAATAKVALRNRLKAEYSKAGSGHISPEQRAKIRSRREAAVSRQNKLVYARQLESVIVRLVEQNQQLSRKQNVVKREFDAEMS